MIPTWGAAFGANAIFNSAEFRADLTHSAVPDKAAPGTTGTFTRATTSTWQNNDGYQVTGVAGEIGFPGARRVRNLLLLTESLTTAATWTKINGGAGSAPVVTAGFTDPDGGSTAFRIQANAGGAAAGDYSVVRQVAAGGNLRAIYVKSNTGVSQEIYFGAPTPGQKVTATTSWSRVTAPLLGGNSNYDIGSYGTAGNSTTNVDILVWHPQLEDVTAQTTQTAGEYVSVGVVQRNKLLSSNQFENANWTATALTATSTTESAPDGTLTATEFSDGVSGGTEHRRFQVCTTTAEAWTASIYAKYVDRQWMLVRLTDSGSVNRYAWFDVQNGVVGTAQAGLTTSIVADVGGWYRCIVTISAAVAGAGNQIFLVATADADGSNIYAGSNKSIQWWGSQLEIGSTATEYQATGGSYLYHGSGVDGVKCFPTDLSGNPIPAATMLGYQAEGARTNLCLQSNAFTTTWVASGTPAATQNVTGPDGVANSAWTLTDNDAGVIEGIYQDITLTAATYTASYFIKKTTGAQASYPIIAHYPAAATTSMAAVTVDTTNGTATPFTAYTGFTGVSCTATCVSFNDSFWRVSVTFTGTAVPWRHNIIAAGTTDPTQSTGAATSSVTGSAVFYGAQVELGSFASSYIATTTLAVTRNADVLTYSSAGNIDGTKGWCYAEYSASGSNPNARIIGCGDGTSANTVLFSSPTAGAKASIYDGTNSTNTLETIGANITVAGASTWGGSSKSVSADGSVAVSGTFDGDVSLTGGIGVGIGGSVPWFGNIGPIYIGQRQLSASELQAITS